MAKLPSKIVPQLFGINEINPNLVPTPVGEWASGGAVTPSFDPEILCANIDAGLTKMTVQPTLDVVLPPSGDMAALFYSFCYWITALQQSGIAEYSTKQEYNPNDYTKAPNGTKIYRCLQPNPPILPGGVNEPLNNTDFWEELDLLNLRQATESQQGVVQLATITDVNAGIDAQKALTVASLIASNINFTGDPTVPTQIQSDNSTKIANTSFVTQKINNSINSRLTITRSLKSAGAMNTYTATKLTFITYTPLSGAGFIYINGVLWSGSGGIQIGWVNIGETYRVEGNAGQIAVVEFG